MHTPERRSPSFIRLGLLLLLGFAVILRSGLLLTIFGLLALTGLAAMIWGKYALERLDYRRRLDRHRCFPGESVELQIEVTNRKILPVTYLSVEDTIPLELEVDARRLSFVRVGKGSLRLLFGLGWYQKVVRRYRVTPKRRGFYTLGPATLSGGDPFGYVQGSRQVMEQDELIVYPRIISLEEVGIPSRKPFGDLKSNDRLFEDPMRFAGTREHRPGDSMSRIHWKATAAAGSLQVKLQDPSANVGLAVFIDTWAGDVFWQGMDTSVIETACVLAASVINWAVAEGLPVGLYANGMVRDWGFNLRVPPARGPEVLTHALEGMARLQMPSRTTLAQLLEAEVPRQSYGTGVVIITRQVKEETAAAIAHVKRSGRPVTLIVAGEQPGEVPALKGVRIYRVGGEEALNAAVLA